MLDLVPGALRGADTDAERLVVLFAAGTGLATVGAMLLIGTAGLLLPVLVIAAVATVRWPALPVGLLVATVIAAENYLVDTKAPLADRIYGGLGSSSPVELITYLAVGCVAIEAIRRRRVPPMPLPIGVALLLLAVALIVGSLVGYFAGAGLSAEINGLRNVAPVVLVTPLVVAVFAPDRVRAALAAVAMLLIAKAVLGVALTAQTGGGIAGIVYYEVSSNWLFLAYLMVVLAAAVRRVPMPWWVWAGTPFVAVAFAVGLKRALWLGGIVGIMLIVGMSLSRLGRRLAVPALAIAGLIVWTLLSSGISVTLDGPVGERINSLDPTTLRANAQDRYRLDERASVWAEIKRQPLTGLGQGVPWRATRPLGIEHDKARDYVHNAVLWFWIKYSLLGALGYVTLMLGATFIGIRAARTHPRPETAAFALGLTGAIVALWVAEIAGTWTGANNRFTVLLGATIGLLCVIDRQRVRA